MSSDGSFTAVNIFGFVLMVLQPLCLHLPSLHYLHKHQKYQRVKSRNFTWIAVHTIMSAFTGLIYAGFRLFADTLDCKTGQVFGFALVGFSISSSTLRIAHLYATSVFTRRIRLWEENLSGENDSKFQPTLFSRFCKLKNWQIYVAILVISIPYGVPAAILRALDSAEKTLYSSELCAYYEQLYNVYTVGPLFVVVLLQVYFLIRLCWIPDSIGMRTELYALWFVVFAANAMAAMGFTTHDWGFLIFLIPTYLIGNIIILVPLVLGIRKDLVRRHAHDGISSIGRVETGSGKEQFLMLLNDVNGNLDFLQYCASEYSAENMIFWNLVEDYEKGYVDATDKINKKKATMIYDKFIHENSLLAVNISYEARQTVADVFLKLGEDEAPPKNVFSAVQDTILSLMYFDTFRRFSDQKKMKK